MKQQCTRKKRRKHLSSRHHPRDKTSKQVDLEDVPLPTPAPTVPTGGFGGEASIPGLIEAEEYDYGGNGVGYGDTTPGNSGGVGSTVGQACTLFHLLCQGYCTVLYRMIRNLVLSLQRS